MSRSKTLVKLHRWVGLTAAIFLFSAGLTGTLLVYRAEIERLIDPEISIVERGGAPLPLDSVAAAVRAAYPGRVINHIRLGLRADAPHEFRLDKSEGLRVYADPYTGRVLGQREPTETLTGIVFLLHTHLLAGHWGEQVVGVVGLLLFALCVTGAILWWPGWSKIRSTLRVKWDGAWKRVANDLHRAVGALAVLFLVMTALTGAAQVFAAQARALVNFVTSSPAPPPVPKSTPIDGATTLPLQRAVDIALATLPGEYPTRLTLPADDRAVFVVRGRQPGELSPNGKSYVYIDQYSGRVLLLDDAVRAPLGTRVTNLIYPIHSGRWVDSWWGRLPYVLLGLAPVVLMISGVLIWYGRGRRAASKPRRLTVEPSRRAPAA